MEQNSDNGRSSGSQKFLKLFMITGGIAIALFMVLEVVSAIRAWDDNPPERVYLKAPLSPDETVAKNPEPFDYAGELSGEVILAINAIDLGTWTHFKFSTGKVFKREKIARDSLDWDIALRRAKIITNGGATNPKGKGAIAMIEKTDFDSVTEIPSADAFVLDVIPSTPDEPKNIAIDKWYKYDFIRHKLKPKKQIFIARTVDGNFAKFEILGYYCGKTAGCYRLKYVYQGTGSPSFLKAAQ